MSDYKYELEKVRRPGDLLNKPWKVFQSNVHKLGENQLSGLLKLELAGKKRKSFAMRIFARLSTLRVERERTELENLLEENEDG